MNNSETTRKDELLVITQGVRGGKMHSNLQGQARLKVTKGFNEPENSITIDVFEGLGHSYNRADTAKINIQFSDGTEWNGNFDKLKKALGI